MPGELARSCCGSLALAAAATSPPPRVHTQVVTPGRCQHVRPRGAGRGLPARSVSTACACSGSRIGHRHVINLTLLRKNDRQESGKIREGEQNWDPLLDVRQRPVPRSVSSLTERPPFGTPEGRGGQSFFEGTHNPVFRAVEQPVAANKIEPSETLAEYRGEWDRQQPRLGADRDLVERGKEPNDAGVQRQ